MQPFRIQVVFRRSVRTVAAVLLLCAPGCQNGRQSAIWFEQSNAEKRYLEDQLYEWQYEYERLEEENQQLREQLDDWKPRDGTSGSKTRRSNGSSGRTGSRAGTGPKVDEMELEAPEIDLGTPKKKSSTAPAPRTKPLDRQPGDQDPDQNQELELVPATPRSDNRQDPPGGLGSIHYAAEVPENAGDDEIDHIVINPILTKGIDQDGRNGDDAIAIVLEPRDANGQFLAQSGPISLVLLDPRAPAEQARVGRWDFDAVESNRFLKDTRHGRGIHLTLPLDGLQPEHAQLRLVARLQTIDGRKLEKWHDLRLNLVGMPTETWSPRSERRRTYDSDEPADDAPKMHAENDTAAPRELPELDPPDQMKTWTARTPELGRPNWKPTR